MQNIVLGKEGLECFCGRMVRWTEGLTWSREWFSCWWLLSATSVRNSTSHSLHAKDWTYKNSNCYNTCYNHSTQNIPLSISCCYGHAIVVVNHAQQIKNSPVFLAPCDNLVLSAASFCCSNGTPGGKTRSCAWQVLAAWRQARAWEVQVRAGAWGVVLVLIWKMAAAEVTCRQFWQALYSFPANYKT